MINIIPNWHPVFVHFTVALLLTAVLLLFVSQLMPDNKLREQCRLVGFWNLWLGAVITVLTVLAGVVAYNTVAHDTPSHEAMTEHRNWALVTAVLFVALAIWSWTRVRSGLSINNVMLILLLLGGGLLLSTAWHGGEVVYRYGLGVMSLPKADAHGHADGGGHDHESGKEGAADYAQDHHHGDVEYQAVQETDSAHSQDAHDNTDGHHDIPEQVDPADHHKDGHVH